MSKIDIVVGSQWGDEGKGKIVDLLCPRYDGTARFNGSDNAGHTTQGSGRRLAFNQAPIGSVYGLASFLTDGVIVDLKKLIEEMDALKKISLGVRLMISSRAHIKTEEHRSRDASEEKSRGKGLIGTTLSGNGPAYADKAARKNLRAGDLAYDPPTHQMIGAMQDRGIEIGDTSYQINKMLRGGLDLVFEGAHGIMLDIDHGTYPFVSSSGCTAGAACQSAGISPQSVGRVIGVTKVYTTRIGTGPMPTEIEDQKLSNLIREKGHEYGTVTKRPRRVGWFDMVALKHAIRVGGITEIALTRADILSGLPIMICMSYETDDEGWIDQVPSSSAEYARAKPKMKGIDSWSMKIGAKSLPVNLIKFAELIEVETGIPVTMISTGPEAAQTILINKEDRDLEQ